MQNMTPDRWEHIQKVYQSALELALHERAGFLSEACSGDESLRREVDSLIAFEARAERFLEVPAFEAASNLFFQSDPKSMVGMRIGPYKIESQLGAGGMGEVYLAEDSSLDRRVAIKFLPPDLQADEPSRRRLIREGKAAAKLSHPSICAIYEVVEEANHSFIVMEYVEGETLASKLQRDQPRLGESLKLVTQVADAVVEAHSRGIIHRDIKPQNVMITPRGRVKVLDFGLAKVLRPASGPQASARQQSLLSMPGVILGTAPYMSPEQAKGLAIDARTDLFSLGVMLYECIAGRLPFSGDTPMEICAQVIQVEPPPPSQFNPSVSPELDAVTLKALAKEPAARYQSAEELLEDLRWVRSAVLGESAIRARPRPQKRQTTATGILTTLSGTLRRPRVLIPVVMLAFPLALLAFWSPTHRPSPEASVWYRKGIEALHNGAYYTASQLLEQSVETDDKFALAHARLAEAYAELDYSEKADKEIIRAQRLVPDHSKLAALDALYFQAVTHVLLRELAPAIERYHEMVRLSPEADKAQAYVDLGRAYEIDDQLDKAKENYGEAARLAPEDAAAFLRLGIVCVQQYDEAGALEVFQKAETIYRDLADHEGIAEVYYQRGILFNNRGELGKARAELEQALEVVGGESSGNLHQQIRTRLELSRSFYTEGQITLAQQYAKDANDMARASHSENLATRGLIEIGSALMVLGNYQEAQTYLAQALQYAEENKGRRNEARALMALGRLRLTVHDGNGGLSYIQRALPIFEKGGYTRDAALAHYEIGRVNYLAGNYDAAVRDYEQGLDLAERVRNEFHSARLHSAIGYVHADQERYPDALDRFSKSYAIYSSLGNALYIGYEAINRGNMMWRLGGYEEARAEFARAYSIAAQRDHPNMQMLARLSLLKTQMLLSERRMSEAKVEGRRALDLHKAIGEKAGHEAEVMYTLGVVRSLSGERRRGKEMTEQALNKVTPGDHPWMFSGALLALAEARLESGNAAEALSTALEAQTRFQQIGQQESAWRAWLIAGRASLLIGHGTEAVSYASNANGILSGLRERWGSEAFNDYVTRPDVQNYREQINRLLAMKN